MRLAENSLARAAAVCVLFAMGAAPAWLRGPYTAFAQAPIAGEATADFSVKTVNRDDGEPLARFLQIADTHVYEGSPHATNHCALANEKMHPRQATPSTGFR